MSRKRDWAAVAAAVLVAVIICATQWRERPPGVWTHVKLRHVCPCRHYGWDW